MPIFTTKQGMLNLAEVLCGVTNCTEIYEGSKRIWPVVQPGSILLDRNAGRVGYQQVVAKRPFVASALPLEQYVGDAVIPHVFDVAETLKYTQASPDKYVRISVADKLYYINSAPDTSEVLLLVGNSLSSASGMTPVIPEAGDLKIDFKMPARGGLSPSRYQFGSGYGANGKSGTSVWDWQLPWVPFTYLQFYTHKNKDKVSPGWNGGTMICVAENPDNALNLPTLNIGSFRHDGHKHGIYRSVYWDYESWWDYPRNASIHLELTWYNRATFTTMQPMFPAMQGSIYIPYTIVK